MHCDKINLYHQSLLLSQKTTKKIGHNEKATTWSYRRGNRSRWTPMGALQLLRKMEDRQLYQQVSISMGLGLTAAHEMCTVVRATYRKPHKFSGLGKQKRKAGKPWMFKESRGIYLPDWTLNHTSTKQTQSHPVKGKRSEQSEKLLHKQQSFTVQALPRKWLTKTQEKLFASGK